MASMTNRAALRNHTHLLAATPTFPLNDVSTFALSFSVPGPVVGKGRPRFGQGRTYTPTKTLHYEGLVRHCAALAMRGGALCEAPLRVLVTAYMAVPPSYSRRKREGCLAGLIWPTGKPDADNIIKVLDACNGVVFRDDSQIVDARVLKVWAEVPSLSVEVWAL
jgi:Holliday junction resolvase RusA-like endonuclease